MVANVGKNISVNTTSNMLDPISIGSTVSVTLVPAQLITEETRIKVIVYNDGNQDLWVKLQLASTDNDKKGILVEAGERYTLIEGSDIYTGEISAIMDSGGVRDVYVTWF